MASHVLAGMFFIEALTLIAPKKRKDMARAIAASINSTSLTHF